jgi:uncharacterized protein YidB (DUF937 family)
MKSIFRRAAKDPVLAALDAAAALEGEGRALAAIDLLNDANRQQRSAAIEVRLVETRHRAFGELGGNAPAPLVEEPVDPGAKPDDDGLPVLPASQMTPGRIAGALASGGALIVRGLVDPNRVRTLVQGIDRAFSGHGTASGGAALEETAPWYVEFAPEGEGAAAVAIGRGFLGDSGVWTADSPHVLFELLESFEQAGVREVVTGYLGERPALSVNKGTLRRARPTVQTAWWHQDGAFLGRGIRSLNIWLSLSHSGRTAPGLEVVPKRLDGIVETGTAGADFDWSVGESVVAEVSGGRIARPVFEPGDALLFDHLCLHRTFKDPGMTDTRYATETWFFAPSAYPDPSAQVPLAF